MKVYIVCRVDQVHIPAIQLTLAAFSTRRKVETFVQNLMNHASSQFRNLGVYTRPSIEIQELDSQ